MARAHNKRSLTIARHRTSVSLEDAFWDALTDLARADGTSVAALIGEIETGGAQPSLSAAIRLYVLERTRGAR
jgi:predicted DNA-binding ribbon-helix-helix protein